VPSTVPRHRGQMPPSAATAFAGTKGGGRGYFFVPVVSPAATYRATVQSFDKVLLEAPPLQAP
jgi:hypothetical protein